MAASQHMFWATS